MSKDIEAILTLWYNSFHLILQATHTTLIENNAFGKINFPDVDTTTQPQVTNTHIHVHTYTHDRHTHILNTN